MGQPVLERTNDMFSLHSLLPIRWSCYSKVFGRQNRRVRLPLSLAVSFPHQSLLTTTHEKRAQQLLYPVAIGAGSG